MNRNPLDMPEAGHETLSQIPKSGDDAIFNNLINFGLCLQCENLPHCVWSENDKIYCEHYE